MGKKEKQDKCMHGRVNEFIENKISRWYVNNEKIIKCQVDHVCVDDVIYKTGWKW